jgi:hypothetical protein
LKNKSEIDLGFTFQKTKKDEIVIFHHGVKAIVLRKFKAIDFKESIHVLSIAEQQQLMARLTGNYKRNNERKAKNHPRNTR